ncbi:MAG: hypothetical protein WC959_02045 [Kiritimatiellales bacterium]
MNTKIFSEEIILDNGAIEAVIRPDIGRIISFRRAGEKNLLWVADDPLSIDPDLPFYGGLRILISPEGLWEQIRQVHRPDPATDGGAWTVLEKSELHIQLQTFSPDLGVEVGWKIQVHAERAEMKIDFSMTRTKENPFPVHLWSIAQVPLGGDVFMESRPHIPPPYHNFLRIPGGLAPYMESFHDGRVYRFHYDDRQEPLKAGTFGRWIAYAVDQTAFVLIAPEIQNLPYYDRSNLQAFSFPRLMPFYELEITSPTYSLRLGESFQTGETWLLTDAGKTRKETVSKIQQLVQPHIQ